MHCHLYDGVVRRMRCGRGPRRRRREDVNRLAARFDAGVEPLEPRLLLTRTSHHRFVWGVARRPWLWYGMKLQHRIATLTKAVTMTQCHQLSFRFGTVGRRQLVGRFDGGHISSFGGAGLMMMVERITVVSARKLRVHPSNSFPDQQMFAHMYDRLQRRVT